MPGRIRTIKPEWLEDEQMLCASPAARVLSVGLILLADDYGRGVGTPDLVVSRIFPRHSRDCLASFEELRETGYFFLYQVRGQTYYQITKWKEHQRVDKPGKQRIPGPYDSGAKILETLAKSQEIPGPDQDQDQDQDQELGGGAGEPAFRPDPTQPDRSSAGADLPSEPTGSARPPKQPRPRSQPERSAAENGAGRPAGWAQLSAKRRRVLERHLADCEALWERQTAVRARAIPGSRALAPAAQRLARIAEILEHGATREDCESVLEHYGEQCRRDASQAQWFDGVSNWRADNFDRALGRCKATRANGASEPDLGDIIAAELAARYEVPSGT